MKVKSPAEVIKEIRCNFMRVWEYDPPFPIIMEEINEYIDSINKRMLLLMRQRDRETEPERKQLYTDMIRDEGDKLGTYLEALDLVKVGRYE